MDSDVDKINAGTVTGYTGWGKLIVAASGGSAMTRGRIQ